MKKAINELSNAEINWQGTYAGLTPILCGEKVKQLDEMGEQAIPDLIEALANEHTFVAAHVLLTRLSGVDYQAFPAWNGLVVEIAADGTVAIDPEQRFDLARQWQHWYRSQPRPQVLPPTD